MVKIPKSTQGYNTPDIVSRASYNVNAPKDAFLDKEALELGMKAQNQEALGKSVENLTKTIAGGLFKIQDRINKTDAKDKYTDFYREYNEWLNNAKNDSKYKGLKGNEQLGFDAQKQFKKLKDRYVNNLDSFASKRFFNNRVDSFEASSFTSLSGYQAEYNNKLTEQINTNLIKTHVETLKKGGILDPSISADSERQIYETAMESFGEEVIAKQFTKDAMNEARITSINSSIGSGNALEASSKFEQFKEHLDANTVVKINKKIRALNLEVQGDKIASSYIDVYGGDFDRVMSSIPKDIKDFGLRKSVESSYLQKYRIWEKQKKVKMDSPQVYNSLINTDNVKYETNSQEFLDSGYITKEQKEKFDKARLLKSQGNLTTQGNLDIELFTKIIANPMSVNLKDHVDVLSQKDFEMLNDIHQKTLTSVDKDSVKFGDLTWGNLKGIYKSTYGSDFKPDAKGLIQMETMMTTIKKMFGYNKAYWNKMSKNEMVNDIQINLINTKGDVNKISDLTFRQYSDMFYDATGFSLREAYIGLYGNVPEDNEDLKDITNVYRRLRNDGWTPFRIKNYFYNRIRQRQELDE